MSENNDLSLREDEAKILHTFIIKLQGDAGIASYAQVLLNRMKEHSESIMIDLKAVNISDALVEIQAINNLVFTVHDIKGITTPEGKILLEQIRAQADTLITNLKFTRDSVT